VLQNIQCARTAPNPEITLGHNSLSLKQLCILMCADGNETINFGIVEFGLFCPKADELQRSGSAVNQIRTSHQWIAQLAAQSGTVAAMRLETEVQDADLDKDALNLANHKSAAPNQ